MILKKEYVYNLYGNESKESNDRFMRKIINSSKKLYKRNLSSNKFGEILLFPWKKWSLFTYLNDNNLLDSSNKLCATSLKEVASYYSKVDLKDDHADKIEGIKKIMAKNKDYIDHSKNLAVFETGKPRTLYLIDGYHRAIAYQQLLQSRKLKYHTISFVVGEINDIKSIGRLNIMFTMINCRQSKK